MSAIIMKRAAYYRLAGRTLRFRAYVALEIITFLCLLLAWLQYSQNRSSIIFILISAGMAILHNGSMTLMMPWKLLKCILVTGCLVMLSFLIWQHQAYLLVGSTFFTLYYLLEGEKETRSRAGSTLNSSARDLKS